MVKGSDYFKVLEYLQRYQNDSGYHDIETLLGEGKEYRRSEHYQRVIQRLGMDRMIEVKTGSGGRGLPPTRVSGELGGDYDGGYRPLLARITYEGLLRFASLNPNKYPSNNPDKATNAILNNSSKKDAPTGTLQRNGIIVSIILFILTCLFTVLMKSGVFG